ncbi:cell wall hydrolase [Halothermothrix orenii]|uniref:Cell wall hydrolase SleB n=1 Tax=Halothermothrix orenii (strain H 168 / OCM 544 / DSM 9562) TaxID=373903 RepID=B8D2B8_HALOH|nr:cell wall hydrolase [Halothermothrix orenii]ACL69345.1 cell wall hydrolase SleB [Halothermothrix orenii H 168]
MKEKMATVILILLFVTVFILDFHKVEASGYYMELGTRILKKGDEGPDVAILQRKLKELNLYRGKIDGIFGPGTEKAVKLFQEKNKLKVDGIVGPGTYSKLPKGNLLSRMDISRDDILLLARIIHGEARGESFKGKVAVGAVILNRVASRKFPDTIREVILQKGQFSCLLDGQANLYPSAESIEAAKAALLGYDPTYGSMFFYNPDVATNTRWISTRPVMTRIGDHVFLK